MGCPGRPVPVMGDARIGTGACLALPSFSTYNTWPSCSSFSSQDFVAAHRVLLAVLLVLLALVLAMATVAGPVAPRHPSPYRRPAKQARSSPSQPSAVSTTPGLFGAQGVWNIDLISLLTGGSLVRP